MKSKYVCQGQRLRLRCDGDYVISILGAKYGRLEPGSSICPHENITDMNCREPDALLRLTGKCNNKRKCTVKADHTMFGDPCPGTFKYLDVIYRCSKLIFSASIICFQDFEFACQKKGQVSLVPYLRLPTIISLNEFIRILGNDTSELETIFRQVFLYFFKFPSGKGYHNHLLFFRFALTLGCWCIERI